MSDIQMHQSVAKHALVAECYKQMYWYGRNSLNFIQVLGSLLWQNFSKKRLEVTGNAKKRDLIVCIIPLKYIQE